MDEKEILKTIRKVEVNLSLLDDTKHILKYVKFLIDLWTHKKRLKDNEKVNMGRNVSVPIENQWLQFLKNAKILVYLPFLVS